MVVPLMMMVPASPEAALLARPPATFIPLEMFTRLAEIINFPPEPPDLALPPVTFPPLAVMIPWWVNVRVVMLMIPPLVQLSLDVQLTPFALMVPVAVMVVSFWDMI